MFTDKLKELQENLKLEQHYRREALLGAAVHAIGTGILVVLLFLFLVLLFRYCHHAREVLEALFYF